LFGMLVVETIAKIRRLFFHHKKPIKAISRELKVSRRVVRKAIRSEATEFRYERSVQPMPKLGAWREQLDGLLAANEGKPARRSWQWRWSWWLRWRRGHGGGGGGSGGHGGSGGR
jgi:hypothetical protein